jgi:hypothetical protein
MCVKVPCDRTCQAHTAQHSSSGGSRSSSAFNSVGLLHGRSRPPVAVRLEHAACLPASSCWGSPCAPLTRVCPGQAACRPTQSQPPARCRGSNSSSSKDSSKGMTAATCCQGGRLDKIPCHMSQTSQRGRPQNTLLLPATAGLSNSPLHPNKQARLAYLGHQLLLVHHTTTHKPPAAGSTAAADTTRTTSRATRRVTSCSACCQHACGAAAAAWSSLCGAAAAAAAGACCCCCHGAQLCLEQDVSCLEVAVDDALTVQVVHGM